MVRGQRRGYASPWASRTMPACSSHHRDVCQARRCSRDGVPYSCPAERHCSRMPSCTGDAPRVRLYNDRSTYNSLVETVPVMKLGTTRLT